MTDRDNGPHGGDSRRLSSRLARLAGGRGPGLDTTEDASCTRFYERYYRPGAAESMALDPRMALRRETIGRSLEAVLPPDARVLDVGCGVGDALQGLAQQPGWKRFGMDFSLASVQMAQRSLGDGARLVQGDIRALPYPAESMDACLCLEVIEHIEDDGAAVRELWRVLKPAGRAVISVPPWPYRPEYLASLGHFRHYTRSSLVRLLEANGFACESYLPNYVNWYQAFSRPFFWVQVQARLAAPLLGRQAPCSFRWPWQRRPAILAVCDRLAPVFAADARLDYSTLETSTFVLARKVTPGVGGEPVG